MARPSYNRVRGTALGCVHPFRRYMLRDAQGNSVDPNTYIYGNEVKKLKKVRQQGSRRVKVAIRRLCKQELHEAEVLKGVRTLKEGLRNKEKK
jgi:hypothetical protein